MPVLAALLALGAAASVQAHGTLSCRGDWTSLQGGMAAINGTAAIPTEDGAASSWVDVSVYKRMTVNDSWSAWLPCEQMEYFPVMMGSVRAGMCNASAPVPPVWLANASLPESINNTMGFAFGCKNQPRFMAYASQYNAVPDAHSDEDFSIYLTAVIKYSENQTQYVDLGCCTLEMPTSAPHTMPPTPAMPVLFTGIVNLNQADHDYNAVVAGSVTGVLCGFTALIIVVFGFLEK